MISHLVQTALRRGDTTRSSPSRLALILGIGVAFDIAFNGSQPGVSIPLFFGLVSAALWQGLCDSRARALLIAATLLSIFPSVRATEGLIAIDVLAACALLGTAVAFDHQRLLRASITDFLLAAARLSRSAFSVPRFMLSPVAAAAGRIHTGWIRTALGAILVAVPVVALFAVLLGSADRVFADLVTPSLPDWSIGRAIGHLAMVAVGACLFATLFVAASTPAPDAQLPAAEAPRLRLPQWIATLAGVDALFALFVGVQFAFLFGGRNRVLVTPGLTYAQYARSGFFQLIAVALLTILLIVGVWDFGSRPDARAERAFRGLTTGLIGLSFVILASAFARLHLYEDTYGFTSTRFSAYVAICWIGIVLGALLVCVWTGHRARLLTVALATMLLLLLGSNAISPDRFVADRNAARWRATGKLDVAYLGWGLGPDAIPVTTSLLRELDAPRAKELRVVLCERRVMLESGHGWRSFNIGRTAARRALAQAGITRQRCAAVR